MLLTNCSFNYMSRTSSLNVHMNTQGIHSYFSFAWPVLLLVHHAPHWDTAQDRIWLRLCRSDKPSDVNYLSSLLYTRLFPCLHGSCQISTGTKNERLPTLHRLKLCCRENEDSKSFFQGTLSKSAVWLISPGSLCICRAEFLNPRSSASAEHHRGFCTSEHTPNSS